MKILYLKDSFEPKYLTRDEVQIAMHAKRRGHDVTIITSEFDLDLKPQSKNFFKNQNKSEIKIIRCKSFRLLSFNTCGYIPNRELFRNYDVIHVHNIGSYSSFLIGMVKLAKKIPVILKADFSEIFYTRLKRNYFLQKVVLKPARLADIVTTYTTRERELLVNLGLPASKIKVIPVGINYEEFSNLKKEPTDFVTIGYLGRFVPQKGIHRIVKPLKKLMDEYRNVKVIFAGQKTDNMYGNNILSKFKKCDRFSYIGFIKSSKEFFSQVDIVVIPSLWETGSIITLESMAAGKAVIASDINPHHDYIEHGVSGFLAKNKEDFYRYCKELIDNKGLRKMVGKNARRRARVYDWGNIFDKVEEMYAHVSIRGG